MGNRIRHIRIDERALTPLVAELTVTVEAHGVTPATEIRGRMVGPICALSSTVEIAYPFAARPGSLANPMTRRVSVPEPNLWSPDTPHLYQLFVELWESGALAERAIAGHGFRLVQMRPDGLYWNGKRVTPKFVECADLSEAAALRDGGYRGVLVADAHDGLLRAAERHGLLVITRAEPMSAGHDQPRSPALLGWLKTPTSSARTGTCPFIGVDWDGSSALPDVDFVVGHKDLPKCGRPRLLRDADGELGTISIRKSM